ncbi:MAG: hypothetical protein KZQ64_02090 [gamma proteobacterium symbiont of Bathyaustriella thionipta]|nr:hypothetical protein [gamma proteobacterium symbiont of Bathyaustriella thionipta]MCU7951199.1 hypothetical protein [gamma proteobacterium symbiont of Bathyaustriella thionipta]MCU7952181.1 hypothetical protein [gamma proteobacterium symbiont of Bathyaustriella thionipta]MCU7957714.1 hypothetical protein [gamma proteobacterium symbiont of Bathyaustriella thionipta]MCU7966877.1 hypothetical protein [gamma proteobacterium symbiont of Bathyaustriella thionipta]
MHPDNRDRLVNEQLERLFVIKARESGVSVSCDGKIQSEILKDWIEKNRENIDKWHQEAEAIVDSL